MTLKNETESSGNARELSKSISDKYKLAENQKEISDAATFSKIAVATGLSPNELREIYQRTDGKGYDTASLIKDFGNGTGIGAIKQKRKDFEESKNDEKTFVGKYCHGAHHQCSFVAEVQEQRSHPIESSHNKPQ